MKIDMTGNPFVDTGIFTIKSHLAKEQSGEPKEFLQAEDIKAAFESKDGFGRWLAKANRQLNAFMMVCGKNSPLTNSATNKWLDKEKNPGFLDERDSGWKNYLKTLELLVEELTEVAESEDLINNLCESCGERQASKVLKSATREWFPLAGSLGSDAQALPAASRSPRICPLCLIAVQWLSLGTCVFNRGLACFQFTEPYLSQSVTEAFYNENRLYLGQTPSDKKIPIPNSKDATKSKFKNESLSLLLFEKIRDLKIKRHFEDLHESVTLNIWTFSNSGQSPDCEVFEIPNNALQFFFDALVHESELRSILEREDPAKPFTHLLAAIEQKREYDGFYPRKLKKGETQSSIASIKLFELYQRKVLGRSQVSLDGAKLFAKYVYETLKAEAATDKNKKKFLEQILKENPRWAKEQNIRIDLRRMFARFCEEGALTLNHYVALFTVANLDGVVDLTPEKAATYWRPVEPFGQPKGVAVRRTNHGWGLFWFYLHHAANGTLEFDNKQASETAFSEKELAMFTNPKIKSFANDVFEMYMERRGGSDTRRGLEWIKKNILDNFSRGRINQTYLRSWFNQLAEKPDKENYANEDFDALCRDDWGNLVVGELLFQTRLELANLYRRKLAGLG
jgi:CRISPR-associated protein Cst1